MKPNINADVARTANHYDSTASGYDASVDNPRNSAARLVFCSLVDQAASTNCTILDFGCGTGTDAHWYAEHGYRVIAYDISGGMLDQLINKYSPDVTTGRIVVADDRRNGLASVMRAHGSVDVISANFAVLNHFDDLHATLAELASYLKPTGTLVASFINPINVRDMRHLWWWTSALRALRGGRIIVHGSVTTYRFLLGQVRRAAAPHLVFTSVTPAPTSHTRWSRFLPLRFRAGALFVTMRKTG